MTRHAPLIIYVSAPFGTCVERNAERNRGGESYAVPADEMRGYFLKDDIELLSRSGAWDVLEVNNDSTLYALQSQAEAAVRLLSKRGSEDEG
jgi:hypothetical protein